MIVSGKFTIYLLGMWKYGKIQKNIGKLFPRGESGDRPRQSGVEFLGEKKIIRYMDEIFLQNFFITLKTICKMSD